MESSVIYSMGTALGRAKDQDLPVAVLVASDWLRGRVLVVDSYGLVLETDSFEHCVVRLEAVNAVRVDAIVHDEIGRLAPLGVVV
jgi:hypothetical protein